MVSTAVFPALREQLTAAPPWGALVFVLGLAAALSVVVAAPPIVPAAAIVVAALALLWGTANPRLLLAALVFAVPFARWTRVEFSGFSVSAADALLALVVAFWLVRSFADRRLPLYIGPSLVAALALFTSAWFSALFADDFPTALGELVKLAEMITIAIYAAATFRNQADASFAFRAMVLAAACESVVAIVQTLTSSGPDAFAVGSVVRAYGDFDQPNALGGYLAMVLPFGVAFSTLRSRGRPLMIASTLAIGLALLATQSRGAWLGTAIGFAVMGGLWSEQTRRVLAVTLVVIGVLSAAAAAGLAPRQISERLTVLGENFIVFDARTVQLNTTNFSLVERMAHWQAGWSMALDHPLIGVGPGNYGEKYVRYFLPGWPLALGHAHNIYINTFAELGLIGLTAFVVFLGTIFARLFGAFRRTPGGSMFQRIALLATLGAVTAFCTHNIFDNMFVHAIGIQFGLLIGFIEAIAGQQREQDAKTKVHQRP